MHPTAQSMTYVQSHHKSQSSHWCIPSSKPTPFPLLNLLTNGIVHQPPDHPANPPNAPPISSATGGPAISHIRHCITSLTWDLLMPLPPQSLANLSTINIQALLLKLKNITMKWYTPSPKKTSPITRSWSKIPCSEICSSRQWAKNSLLGARMYWHH